MAKLDRLIENDLQKFVDGPARRLIADAKKNLAMWMAAYAVVQDGVFAKKEQEAIAGMFSFELMERLKGFLRDIPASEVHDTVYARMKAAREELESVIPTSFDTELKKIQDQVRLQFGNRSAGPT